MLWVLWSLCSDFSSLIFMLMLNAMLSGFKDQYVMEGEEFGQIMLSWEYAETETTYSGIMHIVKFGCEFRLVDDYWLTHLHDCWIDSSDLGML